MNEFLTIGLIAGIAIGAVSSTAAHLALAWRTSRWRRKYAELD
jgi:hypothetical protein